MTEITFGTFLIYCIFPVVLLVGYFLQLEHLAKKHDWSAKKLKIMEAGYGLFGALFVILCWAQFAAKAKS